FLGGDRLKIDPIQLPSTTRYPGLKPIVQKEERGKRLKAVAAARKLGPSPLSAAALATAEAELKSIDARIAADNARYKVGQGTPEPLARAAPAAERYAALCAAKERLRGAEQKRQTAAGAKTQSEVKAAKAAVAAAQKACNNPGTQYTPLSPVYPENS